MYNSATYIMHFTNINMLVFCFYPYILKEGGHINFMIWYIFVFLVHGPIVAKWNSLAKNSTKKQTAKQNTNYKVKTHLEAIVPVSLGNNRASVTWRQSCHCHLGTSVPVYLGTILPLCPSDIGTIFPKWYWHDCSQVGWARLLLSETSTIVPKWH